MGDDRVERGSRTDPFFDRVCVCDARYQYLSLVHFLDAGTWHEGERRYSDKQQQQQQDGGVSRRSVTYADGWGKGGWNEFYRLTSESFGGREVRWCVRSMCMHVGVSYRTCTVGMSDRIVSSPLPLFPNIDQVCDCNRDGHAPWAENRYYALSLPPSAPSLSSSKAAVEGAAASALPTPHRVGADNGGGDRVRVSFLGWFGEAGPRCVVVGFYLRLLNGDSRTHHATSYIAEAMVSRAMVVSTTSHR